MTRQAVIWAFGLIGSLAAHVAILAVLMNAVQPDPVTKQPLPTSELEVQAYQLERTEAREQQPDPQQADADTPDGQRLDTGAIPQSRARAARPDAETLRPGTARPATAAEITQTASALEQAMPVATAIAPAVSRAEAATSVQAVAQPLSESLPEPASLAASPQTGSQLRAARIVPAVVSASAAPVPSAIAAVVRAEPARPAARPAVAILQSSAPLASVIQSAVPGTTSAVTLNPLSASLPVAAPRFAATPPVSPAATVLPDAEPAVTAMAPEPAPTEVVAIAMPDLSPVASAAPPSAMLPQAAAPTSLVPPSNPDIAPAPSQQAAAVAVQPALPNAQKLRAALAFSGGDGDIDPVSVAAFQSFMRPGDLAASGDRLRDGVAGLLAQVPCSRMQVAFDPDTATLQVNGHIPEDDLRAPVLAALRAQMGANITVSDNILILPRPQCGALSGIAGVGLPQSTDQITNPLVIGEDAHVKVFSFAKDDLLSLDMTAPDYDAYIYLDYFDADGMVLHLEPNEFAPLRRAAAQDVQQIGAKSMQDAGLALIIGPPYGQEIAVAFAASEPLYTGLRPLQEPAGPYLEWLKGQVEKARANTPDFKGEWVYFFVSTTER